MRDIDVAPLSSHEQRKMKEGGWADKKTTQLLVKWTNDL